MEVCTAPEDIVSVFVTTWPSLPFAATLLFIVAAVFLLVEFALTFRFGGVPDGFLGALGGILGGVAIIVWAFQWPESCTGTVALVGLVVIGIAMLLGVLLLLFWSARRRDDRVVMHDYDGG